MEDTKEPPGTRPGPRCMVACGAHSTPGTQAEPLHEKAGILWSRGQHSVSENQGSWPGNTANGGASETECDVRGGLSGTLMPGGQTATPASAPLPGMAGPVRDHHRVTKMTWQTFTDSAKWPTAGTGRAQGPVQGCWTDAGQPLMPA